ncbi:hypothetical protein BDW59DRAFT_161043 [Aspergillus cavernicola]|uniref:gamma-glutamylcyclotransferase n=1 Tax=Aspergillus cavernicola TaxID=176166 RepID=A0ABR4IEL3_9EURO
MSFTQTGTAASTPKKRIYFAYGSNLHLRQMAHRCPSSRFLGRAKLYGYRWQINERGYANIVRVPNYPRSVVQGLCYLLSREDEERLDRSEGVPSAYQKKVLDIELFTAKATLVGRDVSEIVDWPRGDVMDRAVVSGRRGQGRKTGEMAEALVYMSRHYVVDDLPKEEYVARMRLGLRDMLDLGISREYVAWVQGVLLGTEE